MPQGLLVLEVAVSPLSLFLPFAIIIGGGMVLQAAVEVSPITKCSKFFRTCDQLNLLCAVQCKMVLFMFKFPCSNCWSLNGLESNLDPYQVM